jgi:hypothetical protein
MYQTEFLSCRHSGRNFRGKWKIYLRGIYADHKSVSPQGAEESKKGDQYTGFKRGASKERCMYTRLYIDAQKAEFRIA